MSTRSWRRSRSSSCSSWSHSTSLIASLTSERACFCVAAVARPRALVRARSCATCQVAYARTCARSGPAAIACTARCCQPANAALGSSRGSSTPGSTSAARTNPTAPLACASPSAMSSASWVAAIRPTTRSSSSARARVCSQRGVDAGLGASASLAKYGSSTARTAGSAEPASSATRSRRRQATHRSRRSAAMTPQPPQIPRGLPRRRSQEAQTTPPVTRRWAGRCCPQSRHCRDDPCAVAAQAHRRWDGGVVAGALAPARAARRQRRSPAGAPDRRRVVARLDGDRADAAADPARRVALGGAVAADVGLAVAGADPDRARLAAHPARPSGLVAAVAAPAEIRMLGCRALVQRTDAAAATADRGGGASAAHTRPGRRSRAGLGLTSFSIARELAGSLAIGAATSVRRATRRGTAADRRRAQPDRPHQRVRGRPEPPAVVTRRARRVENGLVALLDQRARRARSARRSSRSGRYQPAGLGRARGGVRRWCATSRPPRSAAAPPCAPPSREPAYRRGWALTRSAPPTPPAALAGTLMPLGGSKGFVLALAIEVLTGALLGPAVGQEVDDFFEGRLDRPQASLISCWPSTGLLRGSRPPSRRAWGGCGTPSWAPGSRGRRACRVLAT